MRRRSGMKMRQASWVRKQAYLASLPSTPPSTSELIASFPLGEKSAVFVSLDSHEGRQFVNIRTWFLAKGGEWRATYRGNTFPPDELPRLAEAISKARQLLGQVP
jgi:hypothetical protein